MVKGGQRIAVTERGVLVAYLVPPTGQATLVERMIAAGEYEPAACSTCCHLRSGPRASAR